MPSSLSLYRSLVPAHARVANDVVTTWLGLAAQRHTASALGDNYAVAMVWWAAANIEPDFAAGLLGQASGTAACQPKPAASSKGKSTGPVLPEDTIYWARYLDIVGTRAAGAPSHTSVC